MTRPIKSLVSGILCGFLVLAFTALVPRSAEARGVVLDVVEQDIFVNMGHAEGVAVGSLLTLQHVIRATHPVTKEKVRDTFPLGQMRVINVGENTCVVRVTNELFHRVRIGDEVTLSSAPVAHVDPWRQPRRSPEQKQVARSDADWKHARRAAKKQVADDELAREAWGATLGQSLETRLQIWDAFVTKNPTTPFLVSVNRNREELRSRIASEEALASVTPQELKTRSAFKKLAILSEQPYIEGSPVQKAPKRGYEGEPISLALLHPAPGRVERVWLYYRTFGEGSYERQEMVVDGDGYLRTTIAGESVEAPSLQYFIEILSADDIEPQSVLGNSSRPILVVVDESVAEEPPDLEGHSRVTLFTDYVDFDGLGKGLDEYVHAEIDFMYRFFEPIYSLRLGFGTMSGIGGPKDVIDLGDDCMEGGQYLCRRVGYNYAYTEVEERLGEVFAVMLRLQWGSAYQDRAPMEGVDREFFDAFGVRARVRLGRELESNLVLGASTIQRLGQMYEGAFTWDVIPKFPVVLAVQVTDQPVLEDFGVRLISDVGWRHFDWVYPSIRVAYQARDIDHAGLSGGVAANFDW